MEKDLGKDAYIQFRIDAESKKKFFKFVQEEGGSPSWQIRDWVMSYVRYWERKKAREEKNQGVGKKEKLKK